MVHPVIFKFLIYYHVLHQTSATFPKFNVCDPRPNKIIKIMFYLTFHLVKNRGFLVIAFGSQTIDVTI